MNILKLLLIIAVFTSTKNALSQEKAISISSGGGVAIRPSNSLHLNKLNIPKINDYVNLTDIEIQIAPASHGRISISARGIKSEKVKGCDTCNITGKIIVIGNTDENLKYATAQRNTPKNKAANRKIIFRSALGKEYNSVTNSDGKFSVNKVPSGTYSIWVGDKEIVLNYILTK